MPRKAQPKNRTATSCFRQGVVGNAFVNVQHFTNRQDLFFVVHIALHPSPSLVTRSFRRSQFSSLLDGSIWISSPLDDFPLHNRRFSTPVHPRRHCTSVLRLDRTIHSPPLELCR
ncbi:hypothetical protein MRB53_040407 [Persea americana]|nr:hypothetical protein MRB53_040407 [Persea americana]